MEVATVIRKPINRALGKINGIKQLKVGLILLGVLILIAVFAPLIATHNPYALDSEIISPPSKENYLGTDGLGRDVFSMIIYGARTSMLIGVVAALISAIIGVVLGGLGGFYGGKLDRVLNELNNVFMMMPTFF